MSDDETDWIAILPAVESGEEPHDYLHITPAIVALFSLKDCEELIVEDSDDVRYFARQLLNDLGRKVLEASDGTEALDLLKKHRVDLVFSDIVMLGLSGLDLAQQIRKATATSRTPRQRLQQQAIHPEGRARVPDPG